MVRMVVFTTYDGYKTSDTTLSLDVWATVAPEIKQLCTHYIKAHKTQKDSQPLALWITKLLGLPADEADKRRFVELDVPVIQAFYGSPANTSGIFRPCTDPRIGGHEDKSPSCPKHMNANDPNISSDYKTWFINNSISSHTLDNGAPWTQYGYTYDWNEESTSTFGLSEFVVLKSTPVFVLPNPNDATTPYMTPEEYCNLG